MRRTLLALIALMLLWPLSATAQEATPSATALSSLLPTANEIGDGWSEAPDAAGVNLRGLDGSTASYVGPDGARLLLGVADMASGITARAEDWETLTSTWKSWADYYAQTGVKRTEWVDVDPADAVQLSPPDGTADALVVETQLVYFAMPCAVGLYALDSGPAVLIVVEGKVNGATGTEAIESILALIIGNA